MQELEIAIAVIEQDDTFLLQLRDDDPLIGAAGKIGCFGGKVEVGETPKVTLLREIPEETTLKVSEEEVEYITTVPIISDYKQRTSKVHAHIFRIAAGPEKIEALEGKIVKMTLSEIRHKLGSLTPATRAYFETLLEEERRSHGTEYN